MQGEVLSLASDAGCSARCMTTSLTTWPQATGNPPAWSLGQTQDGSELPVSLDSLLKFACASPLAMCPCSMSYVRTMTGSGLCVATCAKNCLGRTCDYEVLVHVEHTSMLLMR